MSPRQMVDTTDISQWTRAQSWEREHWLRNNKALGRCGKNHLWRLLALLGVVEKYRGDDRNRWWKQAFEDYRALPQIVDSAIEVGCGPYTNMRLIKQTCRPKHVCLSDPLIWTYVKFKMTFVHEMHKRGGCCLDDHPLEELPFADRSFDLGIMINVLDHVRDARLCIANLIRVIRPGGFVVVGQDLTDQEDLDRQPEGLAIGHPVTLGEKWFDSHLKPAFEQVLSRMLPREAGWAPQWHYGTLLYIGRKRI